MTQLQAPVGDRHFGSFAGVADNTWKNKSLPTWPFPA